MTKLHIAEPVSPKEKHSLPTYGLSILAVVSFAAGLSGILFGILFALPAVILGSIADTRIRRPDLRLRGLIFARAGVWSGYVGILLAVVLFFMDRQEDVPAETVSELIVSEEGFVNDRVVRGSARLVEREVRAETSMDPWDLFSPKLAVKRFEQARRILMGEPVELEEMLFPVDPEDHSKLSLSRSLVMDAANFEEELKEINAAWQYVMSGDNYIFIFTGEKSADMSFRDALLKLQQIIRTETTHGKLTPHH